MWIFVKLLWVCVSMNVFLDDLDAFDVCVFVREISHALPVYQIIYAHIFCRIYNLTSSDPQVDFSSRGSGNCKDSHKAWKTIQITNQCQSFNSITVHFNQDGGFFGQDGGVFMTDAVLPNITSIPLAIATGVGRGY